MLPLVHLAHLLSSALVKRPARPSPPTALPRAGSIQLTTPVVVTGFVLDPKRARPPTKVDEQGMLQVRGHVHVPPRSRWARAKLACRSFWRRLAKASAPAGLPPSPLLL